MYFKGRKVQVYNERFKIPGFCFCFWVSTQCGMYCTLCATTGTYAFSFFLFLHPWCPLLLSTVSTRLVRVWKDRSEAKVLSSAAPRLVFQSFKDIRKAVQTNLAYLAILPKSTPYLLNATEILFKILLKNKKVKIIFQDFFHSLQSTSFGKLKGSSWYNRGCFYFSFWSGDLLNQITNTTVIHR